MIEPGTESGGDISHEGEEVGYVLEGEFELVVEERPYFLKAGDSFCFRSELRHHYRNTSEQTARVFWVDTPPTF